MTLSLKHKFQSAIPDAGDPTIVQPSNWNDEHALIQATATILGRVTAGDGVTEELTPAQARTLLNVADGATASSTDAFLLARANHTGTQSADTLTDGTTNKAFLATERTKLAGIATGATANSTDAFLLARANHTGTQSADTLTDGTTNKAFLATERTKLAGIATGATANSSDATLLARANHTGTQLASTISDFSTAADARILASSLIGSGTRNRIINGNGAINQRGATAPTDDTYGWDRHNLLTETAAIGISTLTNVANGLPYMMRMTQSQATPQRMGNSQIIESRDCIGLRGKTVALVGKLRNSLAAATRYAILEWTGTADAVTSDIVNSWTNGTFTAGQFFNSTTLNVLAVGVITPTAATVTDFLLPATVGSSANNLILFIWTETAQAQNSTLDVAWELLDYDATGKTYPTEFRPYALELALCQRFFVVFNEQGVIQVIGFGQCVSTTGAVASILLPQIMRATPSMSISAIGDFSVWAANTSALVATNFTWQTGSMSNRLAVAVITVASGLVGGNNTSLFSSAAGARIYAAAEL